MKPRAGEKGQGLVRYDAAIIGAGSEGLAAAIVLAEAGLSVAVVERADAPGGRLVTREFHRGFRASPYCDSLPAIPSEIFRALGLGREGVAFAPPSALVALWPDGQSVIGRGEGEGAAALLAEAKELRAAMLARAAAEAEAVPRRFAFFHRAPEAAWPGQDWARRALSDLASEHIADRRLAAHLAGAAIAGRAGDPALAGAALHLLAMEDGALLPGGLARLASALAMRAGEAGAELRCGMAAAGIKRGKNGIAALVLADGSQIEARAILSTLDVKQTFLSFFNWADLPDDLVARVGQFRMAGGTARVLFALDAPPDLLAFMRRSPIDVAPDGEAAARAYADFCAGIVPEAPPLRLRIVSASDPSLAPAGKAVMTATLGAIPFRLFDGAWTHDKRELLRARALDAAASVLPGISDRVLAAQVIAPPDIEEGLGATAGDLMGGEIAADQMLGMRPWLDRAAPRTPIAGLYLAGASTPAGVSASCVSGVLAARAIMADLKAGRLT